jgi:predicted DNA-binding transcriptional regulator AlpA
MTKKRNTTLLEVEILPPSLVGKRLIRKRTVFDLLGGISDDTLTRLESLPDETERFPRRFRLQSDASKWSPAVWLEHEVLEWIAARAARRDKQSAA